LPLIGRQRRSHALLIEESAFLAGMAAQVYRVKRGDRGKSAIECTGKAVTDGEELLKTKRLSSGSDPGRYSPLPQSLR
jgi:hypothetical protein